MTFVDFIYQIKCIRNLFSKIYQPTTQHVNELSSMCFPALPFSHWLTMKVEEFLNRKKDYQIMTQSPYSVSWISRKTVAGSLIPTEKLRTFDDGAFFAIRTQKIDWLHLNRKH